MPGDHARPLSISLNRAELIILHNALLAEIEAFEAKGESIYQLNSLAEKLEALVGDHSLLGRFRENIGKQRTITEMVDDLESIYRQI